MTLYIKLSDSSDTQSMASLSARAPKRDASAPRVDTLSTMIPVQLPEEEMKTFVQTFHPKRAAKAPQAFMDAARYLAEVSAFVDSIFVGLRYGMSYSQTTVSPANLGDGITRDIGVSYNGAAELEAKAKAYLMSMAQGSNHIIRDSGRYKSGKDILYSGLRGANVSPLLSSAIPQTSMLPLLTTSNVYAANREHYATDVAKALVETGMMIQRLLFGESVNKLSSSYARINQQHEVGYGANLLSGLAEIFIKGPLAKLGIPVMLPAFKGSLTEHAYNRLKDYTSFLVLREPLHQIVIQRTRSERDVPDESLDICTEALALQPDIRFSFAINLPQNFCEYITQTTNEQIPMVPLNTWATVWSAAMLRPPKTRSASANRGNKSQGGRILIPDRAPRYVLRPSASDDLIARRKTLGLYCEQGRVNEDGLFITYNGDLAFLNGAEDGATLNAKAYERVAEEALQLSFEAGTPLAAGQRGSTGMVFDLAAPNYAMKIAALKDSLGKFKGSVQAINWDLNTMLTVSVSDPDKLVSTKLTGGSKPEPLNLATYMREPFNKGMMSMFSRTKTVDEAGHRFRPDSDFFANVGNAVTHSSVFLNFAHLYNHLLKLNKVPSFKQLVENTATEMKISSLDDETVVAYEIPPLDTNRSIYKQLISKNLEASDAGDKTGQSIIALLGVVAKEASAAAGTNLMRLCLRDNIEFTEHDRYFDGARSPVGDFARLYSWFGGEVFHQAVLSVLDIPRKELLEIHDVPSDPTNLEDGHPGFLSIVNEVMPMCVMLGKYTAPATRDAIYKAADDLKEKESEYTESDLNLAGSKAKDANGKGGMKLFPHQGESLVRLKAHPKIAVLDIAPGGGKCGAYTTLVPTSHGLIKLGEAFEVLSTGETDAHGFRKFKTKVMSHDGFAKTDKSYKTAGKTKRAFLSDGTLFEGLPEHKLYALRDSGLEFVRLDQLQIGEWVPKTLGLNFFPKTVPNIAGHVDLTIEMAQILGYLVSEGHVVSNSCGFCNYDTEVFAHFEDLLHKEFGNIEYRRISRDGLQVTGIRLKGAAKKLLISLVGAGLSAVKEVPFIIRTAPKEYQAAFLSALFEGDGGIGSYSSKRKEATRFRLGYGTISEQLSYQVKAMLENFGVCCHLRRRTCWATNGTAAQVRKPAYVIRVEHSGAVVFAHEIGFTATRKRDLLAQYVTHVQSEKMQNTNLFVHGASNKMPGKDTFGSLYNLANDLVSGFECQVAFGNQTRTCALSMVKAYRELGFRKKSSSGSLTKYTWALFKKVVSSFERHVQKALFADADFANLYNVLDSFASYTWTSVEKVVAGSKQAVYDLSVPGPHSYAAMGVMSHNTTIGIADIAMLYADGLIKRPFVFCPNRLVKNWIEDCHKSFAGWNTIPITTETYAEWGEERLTEMIMNAPPNTIVIVGNSFISNTEKIQLVIGNSVDSMSNSIEFCKKFEPDYMILDESHRVRNPRSALHNGIKTITQMSSVKFGRIATGTLIQNVLSDVVGQSAIFNGQIFRTLDEFDEEHKGVVAIVNDKKIVDYMDDTPLKARRRLADFATVISFKRKEWAFMLPVPVETFIVVDMETKEDPNNPDGKVHDDYGHKLQLFYNSVLNQTLKEMRDDPAIGKRKRAKGDEDEDEDDNKNSGPSDRKVTTADGVSIDVSDSEEDDDDSDDDLEAALQPYLQRLERLLTDPFGDDDLLDVAKEIFGEDLTDDFKHSYATPKVAKVIERITNHFADNPWQKGKMYKGSQIVDYNGKSYIYKSDLPSGRGEERSDITPDSDPNWKPQIKGKIFIACRFTRSVDAIYRALPPAIKAMTVRFHGGVDNKDESLARFQNDPKIQILVGNEMGISEGHNFQMASRFIRVEAPWAPGEIDQTAARVFRPDVGGEYTRQTIFLDWVICNNTLEVAKMGRLISKMLKRTQFDELDNPKYYKNLNPANLPIIKMSLDNIQQLYRMDDLCAVLGEGSMAEGINESSYIGQYQYLVSETGEEFREMRKTRRAVMLDVEPTKMPESARKLEFVPWVPNQKVDDLNDDGLLPLKATMEEDDNELAQAFKKDHRALLGQFVRTEFGIGVITKVTTKRGSSSDEESDDTGNEISKVRVQLSQGGNVEMLSASKVYLATNITERNKAKYNSKAPKITEADKARTTKQAERAEKLLAKIRAKEIAAKVAAKKTSAKIAKSTKEVKPDPVPVPDASKTVTLYPVIYNEFLALEGFEDEADSKLLKRHGFTRFGEYAYLPIKTALGFDAALDFLEEHYTLNPKTVRYLDMLVDSFQSGKGRKFNVQLAPVSELPQFYRMRHTITMVKNRKQPELKLYPVLLNGNLMLVVDLVTNPVFKRQVGKAIPGITGTNKFQAAEGMDIHFFRSKADLISKVRELRSAGFTITNLNEIKAEVAKLSLKTLTKDA